MEDVAGEAQQPLAAVGRGRGQAPVQGAAGGAQILTQTGPSATFSLQPLELFDFSKPQEWTK